MRCHKRVTCHSFHPIPSYLVCGSDDGSWSLHDLASRELLVKVEVGTPISSIEIHPDGLIVAMGLVNGKVVIYDLRTQELAIELEAPAARPVSRIEFSNKGMYLAVSWQNADFMRVYSLHKQCAYVDITAPGCSFDTFAFDRFGQFLLVSAGNNIRAFYYRDFTAAIANFVGRADMLCFNDEGSTIIARD